MTLRIIGGTFRNRLLKTPKGSRTRPTLAILRKAVFDICQQQIANARFLDLFAGSGAMGIEAISRGATHATFVEQNRHATQCIRENLQTLSIAPQATLLIVDALSALKKLAKQQTRFDLVYIDPPYATFLLPEILTFFDTHCLLNPHALLFAEEAAPSRLNEIPLHQITHLNTRKFSQTLLHQFQAV